MFTNVTERVGELDRLWISIVTHADEEEPRRQQMTPSMSREMFFTLRRLEIPFRNGMTSPKLLVMFTPFLVHSIGWAFDPVH